MSESSWFNGKCKECNFEVVVTQPDYENFPYADYWWYCSNKKCKNHNPGEHTGDMEVPDWVKASPHYKYTVKYKTGNEIKDWPIEISPNSIEMSPPYNDIEYLKNNIQKYKKLNDVEIIEIVPRI